MALIYFVIVLCVMAYVIKTSVAKAPFSEEKLKSYFSNVQKILIASNMILYKGDKAGENFLIAVKYSSTPISNLDVSKIYEISEKFHIHNKILLTNSAVASNPALIKTLKTYEIQVVNSLDFQKMINNSKSNSVLKTSNTLDDHCKIDKPVNPIQYEKAHSYGILSLFRDKPDRL